MICLPILILDSAGNVGIDRFGTHGAAKATVISALLLLLLFLHLMGATLPDRSKHKEEYLNKQKDLLSIL